MKLESARPIKVSIIGEIIRPGIYSMTSQEISSLKGTQSITSSGLPTVIDALQKAGGITKDANLKNVLIERKIPGPKKEYKIGSINLLDIIFKGDQTQNPILFDGDIITIEKAKSINKNELLEISSSNLSPAAITVRIIGSVYSPGCIPYRIIPHFLKQFMPQVDLKIGNRIKVILNSLESTEMVVQH